MMVPTDSAVVPPSFSAFSISSTLSPRGCAFRGRRQSRAATADHDQVGLQNVARMVLRHLNWLLG